MPSAPQIKQGMGWLGQPSATAPTHASLLDEYLQVQGAAVVVFVVVLVVAVVVVVVVVATRRVPVGES